MEIIFKYWPQIISFICVIGFVFQRLFDSWVKKNEIKFSRLQENKVLEIKNFFKSYQELRISLEEYLGQTQFGEHTPEIFARIKNNIREKLIDFEYHLMVIKLFLSSDDINTIDEIRSTLEKIRIDLATWHIYSKSSNPPKDWSDNLDIIMNEIFS